MIGFHLDELSIKKIGQWPFIHKLMVMLLLTMAFMMLAYQSMVKGRWDDYGALQSQEYYLKTDLEMKYQSVAQSPDYKAQIGFIKHRAKEVFKHLALENEMPELLESLSKIGLSSGLHFKLLTPLVEIEHDFYIESSIKLSVLAHYQQLITFIYRITQMPKIVTLNDVVLSADVQQSTNPMLQMDMIIKCYRYRKT